MVANRLILAFLFFLRGSAIVRFSRNPPAVSGVVEGHPKAVFPRFLRGRGTGTTVAVPARRVGCEAPALSAVSPPIKKHSSSQCQAVSFG